MNPEYPNWLKLVEGLSLRPMPVAIIRDELGWSRKQLMAAKEVAHRNGYRILATYTTKNGKTVEGWRFDGPSYERAKALLPPMLDVLEDPKHITVLAAAQRTKVTKKTMERWVAEEKVESCRRGNRRWINVETLPEPRKEV